MQSPYPEERALARVSKDGHGAPPPLTYTAWNP